MNDLTDQKELETMDGNMIENNSHVDNLEEPEGLADSEISDLGDYPIDSVLIRNETRTVYDVIRRIKKNQYIWNKKSLSFDLQAASFKRR